jgi:Zn finger protein HypA/HybF involved in hydrogenase expression
MTGSAKQSIGSQAEIWISHKRLLPQCRTCFVKLSHDEHEAVVEFCAVVLVEITAHRGIFRARCRFRLGRLNP